MTRRLLTGFLLVAAGFLTKGAGSSAEHPVWTPVSEGFGRAAVAPVGTADPYQGAVEERNVERHSVTRDAVTVNQIPSHDTNVAPVPGAPPGAVPTTGGACPPRWSPSTASTAPTFDTPA